MYMYLGMCHVLLLVTDGLQYDVMHKMGDSVLYFQDVIIIASMLILR